MNKGNAVERWQGFVLSSAHVRKIQAVTGFVVRLGS
jgi:hypothetical protein